ncbi:MAG: hypothetical protein FWE09_03095 [Treponema sp.]|nr:hypothetical protein [Treponema sp.]
MKRVFCKATVFRLAPFLLALALLAEHYLPFLLWGAGDFRSLLIGQRLFYAPAAALAILATLTIFFPYKLSIHAAFCLLWGFLRIADGEFTGALAMCLLGCLLLYKHGFFRSKGRLKLAALATAFAAAFVSQARLADAGMLLRLFELAELGIIACLFVILLEPEIRAIRKERRKRRLALKANMFDEKDRRILQKVLAGAKYDAIAIEEKMSTSALKKSLRRIFLELGVGGRAEFVALHTNHEIYMEEEEADDLARRR